MRDNDEERPPTRYAPRGERDRGSSFGGGNRDRDWKARRDNRSERREDAEAARDGDQRGPRAGGQSSGGRPRLEDMDVFRLAHELAQRTHELTSRFPAEERDGLAALLRRTSASVPARLAAGSSRWDRGEYRAGVAAARDAAAEARYYLLLTKDLGHLSAPDCSEMREGYERVAQMLTRLAQALG